MPDPIVNTTPPPTPPPSPQPWHAGKVDAELLGHMQNHGWHDKSPEEVALAAVKSHREAQKVIGVPPDRVLKIPVDAGDKAGWDTVHQRLGVPKEAKDYDFATIKKTDGGELDSQFTEAMRAVLHGAHVTKDAASEVVRGIVKFQEQSDKTKADDKLATLTLQKQELQKNWGVNKEANMVVAKGAARALGVDPATVDALEGVLGYDKVMEMFRSIGTKIGEDKFVSSSGPVPGVMTREQAYATKRELMADAAFGRKALAGDTEAIRRLAALDQIIAGA